MNASNRFLSRIFQHLIGSLSRLLGTFIHVLSRLDVFEILTRVHVNGRPLISQKKENLECEKSSISKNPKIQKSKNPKIQKSKVSWEIVRRTLDFWIFGFLDFWVFGFLDFWIFGLLDWKSTFKRTNICKNVVKLDKSAKKCKKCKKVQKVQNVQKVQKSAKSAKSAKKCKKCKKCKTSTKSTKKARKNTKSINKHNKAQNPIIQKSKNPKFPGRLSGELWIFGFLDFFSISRLVHWGGGEHI